MPEPGASASSVAPSRASSLPAVPSSSAPSLRSGFAVIELPSPPVGVSSPSLAPWEAPSVPVEVSASPMDVPVLGDVGPLPVSSSVEEEPGVPGPPGGLEVGPSTLAAASSEGSSVVG